MSFQCEICNKEFGKQNKLNRHIRESHENLRQFICQICEKSFKRRQHLKEHEKVHSDDPKPFSCKIDGCFASFSHKYHLMRHIKLIHDQINQCDICQKQFNKKSQIQQHKYKEHGIQKPYQCLKCEKSYVKKSQLEKHSEIHVKKIIKQEQDNDDRCEQIDELIDCQQGYLSDDKDTQFTSSQFVCPYQDCQKSFSTLYNLKTHVRTSHFKVKAFNCEYCQASFFHKKSLNEHLLKIHQIKIKQEIKDKEIYECENCKITYKHKKSLKIHLQKYHQQQQIDELIKLIQ